MVSVDTLYRQQLVGCTGKTYLVGLRLRWRDHRSRGRTRPKGRQIRQQAIDRLRDLLRIQGSRDNPPPQPEGVGRAVCVSLVKTKLGACGSMELASPTKHDLCQADYVDKDRVRP